MKKGNEPLSVRMRKNPDGVIRELASAVGPDVLHRVAGLFNGLSPESKIKAARTLDALDAENEKSIHRAVMSAAANADKDIARYVEEFEACFEGVRRLDRGKYAALGAIEAALAIAMMTPPGEGEPKQLRDRVQKEIAKRPRPGRASPFKLFIKDFIKRRPSAKPEDVKNALLNDDRFVLSDDDQQIEFVADSSNSMKISGIPAEISKARKYLKK